MVPIVFGYPSSETFAAADRGEIALGGCLVSGEDPTHRCSACGEDVILDDGRAPLWCATCGLPLDGDQAMARQATPAGRSAAPALAMGTPTERERLIGFGSESPRGRPRGYAVRYGRCRAWLAAGGGDRGGSTLTAGQAAEQLVEDRVRAALPTTDGYRVFANVAWTGRSKNHGQLTDGEGLVTAFRSNPNHPQPMVDELDRTVTEMERLA